MTIAAIFMDVFAILVVLTIMVFVMIESKSKAGFAGALVVGLVLSILIVVGTLWYFKHTADGQRALVDQKSNLFGGLERTVTVYTANGDIIAQYTGIIDIETNDGGYIKFDFEGKRYIYYNCFVESIANIS